MRVRGVGVPSPDAPAGIRRLTTADHMALSVLWLALNAQWLTIVPIVVPDQVAGIIGPDDASKAGIVGSVTAAGAFVALVVAPISGALSDRLRAPRGRRRPFLIYGVSASCLALLPLALFGAGSSLGLYVLAILNLQFWWNGTAGAYAGLIPDVVPPEAQSRASGWLNVTTIAGTILGNVLVWAFYRPDRVWPLIGAFIVLNVGCLTLTLWRVREPPARGASETFDLRAFMRSFLLDPRANANLYWVLVTRLAANMGVWSVFTFLLFYLESVAGLQREAAVKVLPMLLGTGAVLAIPASMIGVWLAEKYGIVRFVSFTSWIMCAAVSCFALIAINPNLPLVAVLAIVFAIAGGAYGAIDWALALKVLPAGQDAGKDMGIWHVSMVVPQILGPAAMGWMISAIEAAASARVAYAVAFAIAALWFAPAALLVNCVRLPAE